MSKVDKLLEKARDAIKKRNYDYSIELYMQALHIEPDNIDARKELRATELKRAKETGVGAGGFSAYLKGLLPYIKLSLYKSMKKWDECIRECENFLQYDPQNLGVLKILGEACMEAGYLKAAIATQEDIIEQDKSNIPALKALGYLYQDIGDYQKATQYFELVRKYNPNDGEAQKAIRDIAAKGASSQMEKQTLNNEDDEQPTKETKKKKKKKKS
ncbi:MAG: tetratricopeptide repeat protein [Planctomycetota bacterium]|nr:MAG: tetratricopeptide repeat protein [Planctomycetota bacterium]